MRRRGLLLVPAAAATLAAGCTVTVPPVTGEARGRVLLLRGLANIFSTGMDGLAQRVADAGYGAEVHNHTDWAALAGRVVAEARAGALPRPFAVVGHSLGADDAIRLVGAAGAEGVATDLLVTFDPVFLGTVPAGPRLVLNFHQRDGLWGRALVPAQGFAGRIENIALDGAAGLNHFNIEKIPALHRRVLAALDGLAAGRARRS